MKTLPSSYTLLAIESSAGPASCALLRVTEGEPFLLCEAAVNVGLTHSQTLMPMITDMLKNAGTTLAAVDAVSVAVGPGSFTGVRIGVAAAKGIAFANDLPCVAVSTLEGMAYRFAGLSFAGKVLAVMDARRDQVYTALFSVNGGGVERLSPDEALSLSQLGDHLQKETAPVTVIGDGAKRCLDALKNDCPVLRPAPVQLAYQHASGVALAAQKKIAAGELCSGEALLPAYLRLPQAQRELLARAATQI